MPKVGGKQQRKYEKKNTGDAIDPLCPKAGRGDLAFGRQWTRTAEKWPTLPNFGSFRGFTSPSMQVAFNC
jgi:hypothetical protein